ncbi:glycosyltransferase family 2 protein [Flavobacterium sp. ANB]|uniref:glycosyltransferase family 2 protein n=1 Tax=unclassified Flavobacterium TaxID=196869 RepID=UPI0012B7836F|nr:MULTISPECIES: glycosyltransferase family 2 protein [unclassified Flavobacterium]MBF4516294.1 glycosyltransferase family 2 protein [Flavobacterium sp. ANB]MTD69809.1 glycosyltransferase [Flavobacterium sp. LC2016-13]
MLSILIPVYNYNVLPLVNELVKQCNSVGIDFEILCQDDASNSQENILNQEINLLPNCSFFVNESNLGRGKNINSLAQKAKHDWLLILDCDTFPSQNDFIQKYIDIISNLKDNIIFGKIIYEDVKPENEKLLRWIYGNKRETVSILTSNLLIKKDIFLQYPFDDSITKYGYEDLLFFSVLRKNHFKISTIENPTFHINLETSIVFLNKTKTALENLVSLYRSNKISKEDSKIIKVFEFLKKLRLVEFSVSVFKKNKTEIEKNLLSQNPSLFLFDLYKLGYFCSIKK